jgi:hypothetical protein
VDCGPRRADVNYGLERERGAGELAGRRAAAAPGRPPPRESVHGATRPARKQGSVAPCTPWRAPRGTRPSQPGFCRTMHALALPTLRPRHHPIPSRRLRPDPRRRGPPRPSRHGPVNVTRQTPALVRVTLTASDAVNVTQLGDRRFSVTFSGLHTASAPEGRVTRRESNCHRPRNGR